MNIVKLIFISLFLFTTTLLKAQTFIYSYTDPCTGLIKSINVPSDGVTVTYFGQIQTFSDNDFQSGAFDAWAENVYNSFGNANPCGSIIGVSTAVDIAQGTALNFISVINNISALSDLQSSMGGGSLNTMSAIESAKSSSNKKEKKDKNKSSSSNGQQNSTNQSTGQNNTQSNSTNQSNGQTNGQNSQSSSSTNSNNSESGQTNENSTNQTSSNSESGQSNSQNNSSSTNTGGGNNTQSTQNTQSNTNSSNENSTTNSSTQSSNNQNGQNGIGSNESNNGQNGIGSNESNNSQSQNNSTNNQSNQSGNENQPNNTGNSENSNQNTNVSGNQNNSSNNTSQSSSTNSSNESSSQAVTNEQNGQNGQSSTNSETSGQNSNNETASQSTESGQNAGGQGNSNGNGSGEANGEVPGNENATQNTEDKKTNFLGGTVNSTQRSTEGNKPQIVLSSDFSGFNFRDKEVEFGGKGTAGYSAMSWDGKRSYGVLLDYTSIIRGPNITAFYANIAKKRIDLISLTGTFSFYGRGSQYASLALGQMWNLNKSKSLKAIYMATASFGNVYGEKFLGTAFIAGGMYDWRVHKRVDIKMMNLFIYAPYVSYYNDILLKSPYVIMPIVGTNIGITKKFKFNINFGGAYAINENIMNFTLMFGTRFAL